MQDLFGNRPADKKAARRALESTVLWKHGVALLVDFGLPEVTARAFIGRRVKEVGAEAITRGIVTIIFNGSIVDPRAYLGAISLRPKDREEVDENASHPTDGIQPWMTRD